MKWKIQVDQVRTVLLATADKAGGLEPVAKEYADYAERAVRQSQATLVGQAVADFLTHYQDAWRDFSDQVNASLAGARDATMAYVHGQEEMALNAQRAAGDAPAKRRAAEAKAIADNDARQRRKYVE
ncbi:DUF6507 family protein [Kribbella sp. NPDC026611]|uniref:DUF6507 family protein n=1 Tax=Kribbella sp. NPDC026611 TaxID=3154911 RepID=UPI0033D5A21E